MNKANFFIIGAPKAGTTAMSAYLSKHPQVFFSDPKEPHFFNDDFSFRHTKTIDKYNSYFLEAKPEHKAIGEGSVFYLYSKNAIDNILKYNKEAKFVVMLRNPVDIAQAWHSQAIHSFGELESDFKKAWDLCAIRRNGRGIPSTNQVREALYYDLIPKVGEQVERLMEKIERNKVHFIIFDDFRDNTRDEYEKLINFLKLDYWVPDVFPKLNTNKGYKNIFLKKTISHVISIKRKLGVQYNLNLGIIRKIEGANTILKQRETLDPSFEEQLKHYFKPDVQKLSSLLSINLNKRWKIT